MKSRNYFVALALVSLSSTVVLAGGVPEPEATESDSATTSVTTGATQTSITETPSSTATETSASGATASTETEQAAAEPEAEEPGFIAIEDDPLIVDASAIMDDDGMGEVTVQWQISSNNGDWMNISGATQQSFTPREIHVGKRLRVVITYVDGQGNLETLVSPGSNEVENVNDKPTGSPILTGSAREEDALVVETSSISDEDGIGSYEVIWQRSSTKTDWQAFPEATNEVLRLGQEHVGYSYRAIITYVDSHNTREVLISNPSETVTNVDDPVEGEVTITGVPTEGNFMVVRTNGVSDEDGIASLSVSWEYSKDGRNWRAIDSASNNKLVLTQALVGMQVRAKASVVDTFGVETLIYSQPSNTVKNINNAPVGQINVRRVGS
ncbi:MAG: hypothetical protein CNE91_00635 [SAR116 cluster bacterium MED-G04]|jgi:hypothetical protein|nr:MAG: hypothetical protein CNE91_00635 [SAR116 cluster bacterium MED-G04]CAI8453741.1 MAG: Uncharacterised protein [SAR116 cluster bacterium MED-G04]|tara:strand:- start:603 stop:1751 length:1149 start_codon:yes stop_codon:yes gene_type:complete